MDHVDDLSHVIADETDSGFETKLLAAGRRVGTEVKRLQGQTDVLPKEAVPPPKE